MGDTAMTPAQQIVGYLKLTSAHYYLSASIYPSPVLRLRRLIAQEMDTETLLIAQSIVDSMTAFRGGFLA